MRKEGPGLDRLNILMPATNIDGTHHRPRNYDGSYNLSFLLSGAQIKASALLQIQLGLPEGKTLKELEEKFYISDITAEPVIIFNNVNLKDTCDWQISSAVESAKNGNPSFLAVTCGRHYVLVALIPADDGKNHTLSYINSVVITNPTTNEGGVATGRQFAKALLTYLTEVRHLKVVFEDNSIEQQLKGSCGLSVASNIASIALKKDLFKPKNEEEKIRHYSKMGGYLFDTLDKEYGGVKKGTTDQEDSLVSYAVIIKEILEKAENHIVYDKYLQLIEDTAANMFPIICKRDNGILKNMAFVKDVLGGVGKFCRNQNKEVPESVTSCIDEIETINKEVHRKERVARVVPGSSAIRPLSKLAPTNKVQGVYGAEDRNVLEVHEDLSTGATQQFDDGVEFRKRSILEVENKRPINMKKIVNLVTPELEKFTAQMPEDYMKYYTRVNEEDFGNITFAADESQEEADPVDRLKRFRDICPDSVREILNKIIYFILECLSKVNPWRDRVNSGQTNNNDRSV
jgi:hypothetical protein